jgi:hypothetical protein
MLLILPGKEKDVSVIFVDNFFFTMDEWMRSSRMVRASDSQCLGSNPASSDTVEYEGRQMKQC